MSVNQHRHAAEGREQAFRGEGWLTGSQLGSARHGGRETAHHFASANKRADRWERHDVNGRPPLAGRDWIMPTTRSFSVPRRDFVKANCRKRLTPQGGCAGSLDFQIIWKIRWLGDLDSNQD